MQEFEEVSSLDDLHYGALFTFTSFHSGLLVRTFKADETKNLFKTNLVSGDESSRKGKASGGTIFSAPAL